MSKTKEQIFKTRKEAVLAAEEVIRLCFRYGDSILWCLPCKIIESRFWTGSYHTRGWIVEVRRDSGELGDQVRIARLMEDGFLKDYPRD